MAEEVDTDAVFARAAALLNRDERLDEDYDEPVQLSCELVGGSGAMPPTPKTKAPSWGGAQAPRPKRTDDAVLEAPRGKVLPSLHELSQQPVLSLQKNPPPAVPKAPKAKVLPPAESRKATLSAIDAAFPSLSGEEQRMVARAVAMLDDPGPSGAGSPTRAPLRNPRRKVPVQRHRPTSSVSQAQVLRVGTAGGEAPADGNRTRSAPPHGVGGAELEDETADSARLHALQQQAREALASAGEAARLGEPFGAPATPSSLGGGGSATTSPLRLACASAWDPAEVDALGGGMGQGAAAAAAAAQQRVRQTKLAEQRRREEAAAAAVAKEVVAKEKALRADGFREEAKRRTANRRRDELAARELEAAAVLKEKRAADERQQEQARAAAETRREMAAANAARRADQRARQDLAKQQRDAEAAEAAARSHVEGAQLQAKALARVRERRRKMAEEEARAEALGEIDALAEARPKREMQEKAKAQRQVAARRLRERKLQEEAGAPSDGFVAGAVHDEEEPAWTSNVPRARPGSGGSRRGSDVWSEPFSLEPPSEACWRPTDDLFGGGVDVGFKMMDDAGESAPPARAPGGVAHGVGAARRPPQGGKGGARPAKGGGAALAGRRAAAAHEPPLGILDGRAATRAPAQPAPRRQPAPQPARPRPAERPAEHPPEKPTSWAGAALTEHAVPHAVQPELHASPVRRSQEDWGNFDDTRVHRARESEAPQLMKQYSGEAEPAQVLTLASRHQSGRGSPRHDSPDDDEVMQAAIQQSIARQAAVREAQSRETQRPVAIVTAAKPKPAGEGAKPAKKTKTPVWRRAPVPLDRPLE